FSSEVYVSVSQEEEEMGDPGWKEEQIALGEVSVLVGRGFTKPGKQRPRKACGPKRG
ncbi:unnamed protein product, partial [Dovyalis caffra]